MKFEIFCFQFLLTVHYFFFFFSLPDLSLFVIVVPLVFNVEVSNLEELNAPVKEVIELRQERVWLSRMVEPSGMESERAEEW